MGIIPSQTSRDHWVAELERIVRDLSSSPQGGFTTIPGVAYLEDLEALAAAVAADIVAAVIAHVADADPHADRAYADDAVSTHLGAADHGGSAAVTTHAGVTSAHDAANVDYDGTTSGLTATDVQAAIDEDVAASATHAALRGDTGHIEQQAAIADLALTVTNPPTQAEVQAVADKVDVLLAALRTVGVIAS